MMLIALSNKTVKKLNNNERKENNDANKKTYFM